MTRAQRQGRVHAMLSARRRFGVIINKSRKAENGFLIHLALLAEACGSFVFFCVILTFASICLIIPQAYGDSAASQPIASQPIASQPTATQPVSASQPSSAPAGPTPMQVVAAETVKVFAENAAETRRAAAIKIIETRSAEGVQALVAVFASDNNEAAKLAVCQAIAETRSEVSDFIVPLQGLLEHSRVELSEAAASALACYRDPAVVAKLADYHRSRERVLMEESLVRHMDMVYELTVGEEARIVLLQQWLRSSLAMERLKALKIIDEPLRTKGIKPANGVLTQIRQITGDSDPFVRQHVVIVLRDLGLMEDVRRVRAMLTGEASATVREEIYKMLGKLVTADSIDDCVVGLEDSAESVAAAAADALGRICAKGNGQPTEKLTEVVDALIRRMERPVQTVQLRGDLIEAMADIADPKCVPYLVQHAGPAESEPAIRQAALRGIGRVGNPEHLAIVLDRLNSDTSIGVREVAAEAVGLLGYRSEDLRALRTRLDPQAKEAASVVSNAWQAYKLVFPRLDVAEQLATLATFNSQDATVLGHKVELLTGLESQVAARQLGESHLADIREQLGDALIASDQLEEAAAAWLRAMTVMSTDRVKDRARIAAKVAGVVHGFLKTSASKKAVALAAKAKLSEVRAVVADRFVRHLDEMVRSDRPAALAILDQLAVAVPDRFGTDWAGKFDALRKAALPAPSTQSVATQPVNSQPAATQSAASVPVG